MRGYVRPRPRGHRFVQVESELQQAVKAAHRSLQWHRVHDRLAGVVHHHGRIASGFAHETGRIDEVGFKKASLSHREAGRTKHNVSKAPGDRSSMSDKVFFNDPWASWATRPGQQGSAGMKYEAGESRGEDREFDVTVLVDMVCNEALRVLVGRVRAAVLDLQGDGEGAPPSSGDEAPAEGSLADEQWPQGVEIDFQKIDEELWQHTLVRRKLVQEWGRYESVLRVCAEELEASLEKGGDEWWGDGLFSAESVEGSARMFGETEGPLSGEEVIAKVVGHFGPEAETDMDAEYAEVFLEAGLEHCRTCGCLGAFACTCRRRRR